jgi:hypothetical protein
MAGRMSETHGKTSRLRKVALAIFSSLAGAALVAAALRFSFLNWVVDVPGWLVSRIVSVDFHEGEGAFGFFLAIFLSWVSASTAMWFVALAIQRVSQLRQSSSDVQ